MMPGGNRHKPLRWRYLVTIPWELIRIGRNLLAGLPGYWTLKRTAQAFGFQRQVVDPQESVVYAFQCRDGLIRVLAAHQTPLSGCMLEIGPGDNVGPAVLLIAGGIERIVAIDRFPQLRTGVFQQMAYKEILSRLEGDERERARSVFLDSGCSVINPEVLVYTLLRAERLPERMHGQFDLVYSRAVLEHVTDVRAVLASCFQALRSGGTVVHWVDLRSHLNQEWELSPLHFLTIPDWRWRLQSSNLGAPNRVRMPEYEDVSREIGLRILECRPTGYYDERDVASIRPRLLPRFRSLSDEHLRVSGFWLVVRKP